MQYAIVIEKAESNYSAFVPDLPGCVATGETEADVRILIAEAINFHLEGLHLSGDAIPLPNALVGYVEVAGAA
jgi:predicted RNase H-like HicB family nuclease